MRLKEFFSSWKSGALLPRLPLVIAEAGVNHEGSMDIARRLIEEAKEGGADAIKFQTYKAETLASKHSPAYWDTTKEPTRSQYELFKKHDHFWKAEFEELKRHCDRVGIEFLSTPFDIESSVFLEPMMDVVKISSSDITNRPFIEHLCRFGKPILLSVGASELFEIEEAVGWIRATGNPLALLHCILNYPTSDVNANLGRIAHLRQKYPDMPIGYSDHTLPAEMMPLEVAWLLGAEILEKHFTHDKTLPGNDHYHAMDKQDLKRFRAEVAHAIELLGEPRIRALAAEAPARVNARRSLVAARAIPAGKVIEPSDLTWKRPASGVSPRHYYDVIGCRTTRHIDEDDVIQWGMFARER